jgi:threonyl-tRNA synthetase
MEDAYPLAAAVRKSVRPAQATETKNRREFPLQNVEGFACKAQFPVTPGSTSRESNFGWNHEHARPYADGLFLFFRTNKKKEMKTMSKHEQRSEQAGRAAALLLAEAVRRIYPEAKLGMGGPVNQGFYYDFDFSEESSVPTSAELAAIQEEMRSVAAESSRRSVMRLSRAEAQRLFEEKGELWKVELLREADKDEDEDEVLLLKRDAYLDLLEEGMPPNDAESAELSFRLLSVAGAYWQGDSGNAVLQRIYGVAFESAEELESYLIWQEEAQHRDHRKLSKQLELFMFADEAPGMPFYLPKGTILRNELERLAREFLQKFGYEEVRTPFIMDRAMWEQSGHFEHYRENMYFSELDNTQVAVKPMNCPGHMLMFKSKRHSYKELPIRYAEFGQVHRYEFSGALNGLFRVRTFCQDDAHLFVRPDQVEEEILRTIELIKSVYELFGFAYSLELSTRPQHSMGSDEQWELAEAGLRRALEAAQAPYAVNAGDGAFYGPKIDFHIKDALGRSHQCGTVQLDFQMPGKFGLSYIDERNGKRTPIVIHRAVYGSIDRFLGILIEHYAGAFPLWLAPVQVMLLPVAGAHEVYASELREKLAAAGIRAEVDKRNEKLGYRMREAGLAKIPFVAVVGDKEQAGGSLQVRERGDGNQREYGVESFVAMVSEQFRGRKS